MAKRIPQEMSTRKAVSNNKAFKIIRDTYISPDKLKTAGPSLSQAAQVAAVVHGTAQQERFSVEPLDGVKISAEEVAKLANVNRIEEELGLDPSFLQDKLGIPEEVQEELAVSHIKQMMLGKLEESERFADAVQEAKERQDIYDKEALLQELLEKVEESVETPQPISIINDQYGLRELKKSEIAVYLAYSGSIEETAKMFSISAASLRNMLTNDTSFSALVSDAAESLVDELRIKLGGAARKAIDVIVGLMQDEFVDANTRLSAAKDVLNRMGLNETQKVQIDTNNNIHFFRNMSDEELDKIIDVDFT